MGILIVGKNMAENILLEALFGVLASTILTEALTKYLRRVLKKDIPSSIEGLVAYEVKATVLSLTKTRGEATYLRLIYEKAEDIASQFINEMKQQQHKNLDDVRTLLHKSLIDSGVLVSKSDSDELIREVTHALISGLARNYPLFEEIALEEIKKANLQKETAKKLRDGVANLSAGFIVKKRYNIDKIPGIYEKRVFIGGAYDDLPTLRFIEEIVRENGFVPVIAIDFDLPDSMGVHDFDILLLHNCKFAFFELSLAAGQYNEVEWAIRQLNIETVGFCKSRGVEPKDITLQKVSSMVTILFDRAGYPIFTYSNFNELKSHIIDVINKWKKTDTN